MRLIVGVLHINSDLERIGNPASTIAERAIFLSDRLAPGVQIDAAPMAEKTEEMLPQRCFNRGTRSREGL